MHATDAKTQKIEHDPNFFNTRSYLFFNMWKIQMKISDSVWNDF